MSDGGIYNDPSGRPIHGSGRPVVVQRPSPSPLAGLYDTEEFRKEWDQEIAKMIDPTAQMDFEEREEIKKMNQIVADTRQQMAHELEMLRQQVARECAEEIAGLKKPIGAPSRGFYSPEAIFNEAISEAVNVILRKFEIEPGMSPEEKEAQRRSFAYGNTHIDNDKITREMVAEQSIRQQAARECAGIVRKFMISDHYPIGMNEARDAILREFGIAK